MSNLYIILYNIKLWYILNYCSLGFPHNGPNKNPYGPFEITFLRWFFDLLPAPIKQEIKVRFSFHKFISILEFCFLVLPYFSVFLSHDRFVIFVFFSEFSTFLVLFFVIGGWTPQSEIKSSWLSGSNMR